MLYGQVLTNDFGEDNLECSLYHEDTFESSKNVFSIFTKILKTMTNAYQLMAILMVWTICNI